MKTILILFTLLIATSAEAKTTTFTGTSGTTDTRCMHVPKGTRYDWWVYSVDYTGAVQYHVIAVWDCQKQYWSAVPVSRFSSWYKMEEEGRFIARKAGWYAIRVGSTGGWILDVTTPRKRKQRRTRR